MSRRYYFHLTNGEETILDREGLVLSDLDIAVVYAEQAISELRREDPSSSDEWSGWKLNIIEGSGQVMRSISLEQRPFDRNP